METVCMGMPRILGALLLALFAACAAPAQGREKFVVPPEFEKVFRTVFEGSRALDQFTATGTLSIHVVSEDVVKDLNCTISLAKRKPGAFSVSVARAGDGRLLARVVSTGVKGQVSLYLPRELLMSATPNRIGQVTDTYTLPVVITLFDFLDDGKFDRWLSLLGAAEYAGREAGKPAATEHLYFRMNNYWTLRDISVDLWVREGDRPLLARMDVDLSTALTQRGPASWVKPGGSVNLSVLFKDWSVDKEPDAASFEPPTPQKRYGELNLRDVMLVEQSGALSAIAAVGDPTTLISQLRNLYASGNTSALAERLKKTTPEQREQMVDRLHGGAAAKARQMGVTPETVRMYNRAAH
jgi:hypothetical protein